MDKIIQIKKSIFRILSVGVIVIALISCASKGTRLDTSTSMPIYGNWCGLAHPKDINLAEVPIDELDQICQQHDFCYASKGMFDCECDLTMRQAVVDLQQKNKLAFEQRSLTKSMALYFSTSMCNGNNSGKNKVNHLIDGIYTKSKVELNKVIKLFNSTSSNEEPVLEPEMENITNDN